MNESQAISLCIKHRDPIGFEFLVRKYEREAYMHASALLGNRDDAADACQESFARAFASLSRLDELTAFYPWFYRILRNHCLNLIGRRRTANSFLVRESSAELPFAASAEATASQMQQAEKVWQALEALKPEFREILTLKVLRGYDYKTLSELIGIPRGTVMSRLYHARKAFALAFEELEVLRAKTQTGEIPHVEL